MANLLSRAFASFFAAQPIPSAQPLDDEFNQIYGVSGVFNGGTTGFKLKTKTSDATDPVYEFDQVGAGPIIVAKQNGTAKVTIGNDGLITCANTAVNPGLNADRVDSIEGANIAKLDTNVTAFSTSWFFETPPAAGESLHSEPRARFIVPTGTAITVTKLRVQFVGGSHTAGGDLLFQVYRVPADGASSVQIGQIHIDNTAPTIRAVRTTAITPVTLVDADAVVARLEARSGTITETLITVSAIGTQRLT